jgi:hypothetical protein
MPDLFATKTRLALLRAVADGEVVVDFYGQAAYADDFRSVTARWQEFTRAGWATRPDGDEPRWMPGQLTELGRAVLDGRQG